MGKGIILGQDAVKRPETTAPLGWSKCDRSKPSTHYLTVSENRAPTNRAVFLTLQEPRSGAEKVPLHGMLCDPNTNERHFVAVTKWLE